MINTTHPAHYCIHKDVKLATRNHHHEETHLHLITPPPYSSPRPKESKNHARNTLYALEGTTLFNNRYITLYVKALSTFYHLSQYNLTSSPPHHHVNMAVCHLRQTHPSPTTTHLIACIFLVNSYS